MNVEDLEAILEGVAPHLKAIRDELTDTKDALATALTRIAELETAPKIDVAAEVDARIAAALEQRDAVAEFVTSLESSIAAELAGEDARDAA